MRVMGIDPGSRLLGWGVIDASGNRVAHVASGTITVVGTELADRLLAIAAQLDALLGEHRPDAVSVETVFFAKNSQSALKLGQARGVALLCSARSGAQVFEYTAGQIKQATTGRGRADKEQVRVMVRAMLSLSGPLGLDASDALSAAVCHAHMYSSPTAAFLREATREAKQRGRRSVTAGGGFKAVARGVGEHES